METKIYGVQLDLFCAVYIVLLFIWEVLISYKLMA